jgi:biotin carboxyl carrier protein
MKRYQITVDGRTFDVQVLTDPRKNQVQVEVDGRVLTVGISEPAAGTEPAAVEPAPTVGPGSVSKVLAPSASMVAAPLPGVIKSVAVQAGQSVSAGDELLVIEAMKMDNVIRASRDGVIEAMHVLEGHRVAHGELLLEYRV